MSSVEHDEYRRHLRWHSDGPSRRHDRCVVTGAAGFIGSHLIDLLLKLGNEVIGIDKSNPSLCSDHRQSNLNTAKEDPSFQLCVEDLRSMSLQDVFAGARTVFHLAARAGVQDSWQPDSRRIWDGNVASTQAVLDAALSSDTPRVVLASSSSVYGDTACRGGRRIVAPISPYGATKAACEHLANVYRRRGLDVVTLRYFTVFGPRQRADMAMHRLFEAARSGRNPFIKRGSGTQTREFTYVEDVVKATAAAGMLRSATGRTFDIGGGLGASLNSVIAEVERLTGRTVPVVDVEEPPGDPKATVANRRQARWLLRWRPRTTLREGLANQWTWHQAAVRPHPSPCS